MLQECYIKFLLGGKDGCGSGICGDGCRVVVVIVTAAVRVILVISSVMFTGYYQ